MHQRQKACSRQYGQYALRSRLDMLSTATTNECAYNSGRKLKRTAVQMPIQTSVKMPVVVGAEAAPAGRRSSKSAQIASCGGKTVSATAAAPIQHLNTPSLDHTHSHTHIHTHSHTLTPPPSPSPTPTHLISRFTFSCCANVFSDMPSGISLKVTVTPATCSSSACALMPLCSRC